MGEGRGLAKGCSVDVRTQIFQRVDGRLRSKIFSLKFFCFDFILERILSIMWCLEGRRLAKLNQTLILITGPLYEVHMLNINLLLGLEPFKKFLVGRWVSGGYHSEYSLLLWAKTWTED